MASVELGPYRLEIPEEFGPRITGLTRDDGPDLFARLDETVVLRRAGAEPYLFHGGHRLWASPEIPELTYAPDARDSDLAEDDGVVRVRAAADEAGLVKELRVTAVGESLRVDHRLSGARRPVAAWGITQLRLGGTAILALPRSDTAPLPDRSIVVWPYTDMGDSRLSIADDHITIEAIGDPPLKLGTGPVRSRLGYLLEGWLFEKTSEFARGDVPDLGAASQVYVGQGFCELETVGVLRSPGEPALLTETWHLSPCGGLDDAVARLTDSAPA